MDRSPATTVPVAPRATRLVKQDPTACAEPARRTIFNTNLSMMTCSAELADNDIDNCDSPRPDGNPHRNVYNCRRKAPEGRIVDAERRRMYIDITGMDVGNVEKCKKVSLLG